jgi:transposase
VLSEFRTRLVDGHAERVLLDTLLRRAQALGLFRPRGRQRTDSTHVLAAVRILNRLERVGETVRAALNSLAVVAPEWLRQVVPAEWYQRYGRRVETYDLPKTETARRQLAAVIGADSQLLLDAVDAAVELPWLAEVPAVRVLRQVWTEQYITDAGTLRWRDVTEIPTPAKMISSPVRRRSALQLQAECRVGRLQGPSHGELRCRHPAPDHQRRDDAGCQS